MLVFWKQKLVFLSVPKTGTTAYEQALAPAASMVISDPPQLKHAPLYRYNRFFRPMFEKACKTDDMETLAVMREPISWLGSWYRYRQRPAIKGHRNSTFDISFDDFVAAYLQDDQPAFANVGSQAKFLEARKNGTAITHLFQYEDQPRLQSFLEARLEVALDLKQVNVSPRLEVHLSSKMERQLRNKRPEEFELWESIAR